MPPPSWPSLEQVVVVIAGGVVSSGEEAVRLASAGVGVPVRTRAAASKDPLTAIGNWVAIWSRTACLWPLARAACGPVATGAGSWAASVSGVSVGVSVVVSGVMSHTSYSTGYSEIVQAAW